jgi:putative ABC transport system substrate-binding protein
MSYGVDMDDLSRRAAAYVNRILKGTRPADLPVQQPTKYELVLNLKTAKGLGLTAPPASSRLIAIAEECRPGGQRRNERGVYYDHRCC